MTNNKSLVDRTRPESWSDLQGNNKSAKAIKNWAKNWTKGDKPQLLTGPAGVGKTSVANILVNTQGWTLNQINASDSRKSDDLAHIASTIRSNPYQNLQLCLLDEVDSISGRANLKPFVNALKEAKCPIILTANDKYEIPNSIRNQCTQHDFKLNKRSRRAKLKKVVDEEDIEISTRDLARLVERPDLRSALNDLQRFAESDADSVNKDNRDWEPEEFDLVGEQLKGEQVDIPFQLESKDYIMWLDENFRNNISDMDKQLRGTEVSVIYNTLSLADIYVQRGFEESRRYWKYADALMGLVGEARVTEPYNKNWIDKSFPSWFRTKQKKVGDGTAEDKLYSALSKKERGAFGIGGNYTYFRKVLLPIMKDMSKETRMAIAFSARVDDKALDALDISEAEYESFKGNSGWEKSTTTAGNSAMDW